MVHGCERPLFATAGKTKRSNTISHIRVGKLNLIRVSERSVSVLRLPPHSHIRSWVSDLDRIPESLVKSLIRNGLFYGRILVKSGPRGGNPNITGVIGFLPVTRKVDYFYRKIGRA